MGEQLLMEASSVIFSVPVAFQALGGKANEDCHSWKGQVGHLLGKECLGPPA